MPLIKSIAGVSATIGAWVHLRKSNTEPVIKIHTEGATQESATSLVAQVMRNIQEFMPTVVP